MQSIASGISRKIIFISEAVCGPLVDHSLYCIMFAHRKHLVKSIRGIYKQADTFDKADGGCGVNGEAQVQVNRLAITGATCSVRQTSSVDPYLSPVFYCEANFCIENIHNKGSTSLTFPVGQVHICAGSIRGRDRMSTELGSIAKKETWGQMNQHSASD